MGGETVPGKRFKLIFVSKNHWNIITTLRARNPQRYFKETTLQGYACYERIAKIL